MGSSENDVPVPALPVNEPFFSIRDYVLAARDKNISRNWPFPEKYLQTCMIHGVSKVLPPFDSHKSVKNLLYRKEKKSDIGSVLKECTGVDRGKEIVQVNCNISTLNTNSNEEMDEQGITAEASCSKRLNSNGQEENFICVKDVKCDIAPVQNICEGHDREEEILEENDNVISTSNSNPMSNIEENSCDVNMKSDNGSIRKHCVGLNCREELVKVNGDVSATSNSNLKSNEEENSGCVKGDKPDTGAVTCVGFDCKEMIGVNGNESTSNSNPRSNVEENSSYAKDMESDIGSIQKTCVGLDRREDIFEVNGVVSATSNSNLKPKRDENSDCIKDDKLDTGAITCVGQDCKEISEVSGNVSPSDSNQRSNIEENSSCVKDMKFGMGSVQKNRVGLDRGKDIFEASDVVCATSSDRRKDIFKVNGVVCGTSSSNLKSNRDENFDCIRDDKSDTGAVTCVGNDCKEIVEANGNVGTSDSNPRSNEEGNSNHVKDNKSDTGAINFVGVDCEEEIIEVNGNASTSNLNPGSNEDENSDIGSLQNNCVGFNHEEETIEVNSNVNSTSNSNRKFSEEMDEQCLEAAASCSKRLNSKRNKRKRKAKMRLVADVVADAKPDTLEERDKINGSTWAIDQRVIYRRMSSRIKDEDEVDGIKETTAINYILETRSAERLQKIRQDRKNNNTAEDDINVVEKKPTLEVKLKHRKPQPSTVEVNTPIKNDSKSKPVVTRSQVKRSLRSVNGVSTIRRLRSRGKS
ncbi:hypothetical protein C5167_025170 [Papaver somniferum]|uniref:Uncharacterized protein n=1 Tax=Papaver somniferum TaxID=3469 RepID=A0A4Y7JUN8_PAPSO|nr:uncharacterized protein LOC113283966 [Papaver somniferum]RZC63415.1 hypothetical protein C5167_025170 [Papaver somniferum]